MLALAILAIRSSSLAAASLIEVGTTGPSTLILDDGTLIKNGTLTIGSGQVLHDGMHFWLYFRHA